MSFEAECIEKNFSTRTATAKGRSGGPSGSATRPLLGGTRFHVWSKRNWARRVTSLEENKTHSIQREIYLDVALGQNQAARVTTSLREVECRVDRRTQEVQTAGFLRATIVRTQHLQAWINNVHARLYGVERNVVGSASYRVNSRGVRQSTRIGKRARRDQPYY